MQSGVPHGPASNDMSPSEGVAKACRVPKAGFGRCVLFRGSIRIMSEILRWNAAYFGHRRRARGSFNNCVSAASAMVMKQNASVR